MDRPLSEALQGGALAAADPLTLACSAVGRGDLLAACDIAQQAFADGLGSEDLAYQHVLALARMGAVGQAMAAFDRYALAASDEVNPPALHARLLKDLALRDSPPDPAKLARAADAYHAVYDRFGDPFPGINAANLLRLADRREPAEALARELLASPRLRAAQDYYGGVTRAEARLILGDATAALSELQALAAPADAGARSTTRRQLRRLAIHLGLGEAQIAELLAPLAPPTVATFCGHMFAAGLADEAALADDIDATLRAHNIGFGYGALARGADILIAERILAAGGELHVVLPFRADEFIRASVGADTAWRARFDACLQAARSVTYATQTTFVDDPLQFRFGGDVAMGLARLRARHLDAEAVQIAVWDGVGPSGLAGTAIDVQTWRRRGGRTIVLSPRSLRAHAAPVVEPARAAAPDAGRSQGVERMIKAIIFGDFIGFSKLGEDVLPTFWREVMTRIAGVLDRYGPAVAYRNTWGDALYAVIDDAAQAAAIALELHRELVQVDAVALRIDGPSGMRIGAHLGPIYRGEDHVAGGFNFFGTEVSRAARIEPITPPGAVYVTEAFAAVLALEAPDRFACDYVGRVELPKAYGVQRMYRLGET